MDGTERLYATTKLTVGQIMTVTNQISLSELGGPQLDPTCSRFIHTSWMLDVRRPLAISSVGATVRFLDTHEASQLEDHVLQRNVFSRHSYERDFYLQRIREFADRSVIEVELPGDPKTVVDQARTVAAAVEATCIASTALYLSRRSFHTSLGITAHRKDVLDFTIGPSFRNLSASSRREAKVRGITVDKTFVARFYRAGLGQLIPEALKLSAAGRRLNQALSWLQESRLEHSFGAAVVKVAIGYEAVLGGNETEPLRRTLSERTAFLLSDDPELREALSNVMKFFYDARSQVVHGGTRKKSKLASVEQLEAAERVLLLLLVTIASNTELLQSETAVQDWVEHQRWGIDRTIARPFRPGDLKRALSKVLPGPAK